MDIDNNAMQCILQIQQAKTEKERKELECGCSDFLKPKIDFSNK